MSRMRRQDYESTEIQLRQQRISSPKSEVVVQYLQKMALPSMWAKELVEQDYELWDKVLQPYSISAIEFAFETYISGGSRFPTPSQILQLAASHAEQDSLSEHYKAKREAFGVPPAVLLAILPQIVERAQSYHDRGVEVAPPMTEAEIEGMASRVKSDPFQEIRRFPNGNPVYNRTLSQARALLSIK